MPALIYLLTFIVTTLAAAEQAFSASADETAVSLQASLAAGGLEQPQALAGILRELGLPSVQDVRLLNIPEHLELSKSLQEQGVNLGSRSKLRRLSEKAVEPGDEPAPDETLHEKSRAGHRKTPGAVRSEREQRGSSSTRCATQRSSRSWRHLLAQATRLWLSGSLLLAGADTRQASCSTMML